jgi:hypothetical protein
LFSWSGSVVWPRWLRVRVSDRGGNVAGPGVAASSDHPTLLVTWGFFNPTIVLPASAPEWSEERMRIVRGMSWRTLPW